MNKPIITLIGFLLFIFGMLNLVVALVGVKLAPFVFLDAGGNGLGLLIKLLMVIIGVVLIAISRSNFDGGTLPEEDLM